MATNYSEYSRLRSIARKRSERLGQTGAVAEIHFPTVKELKTAGIAPSQAMKAVNEFLNAPTTKKAYMKAPDVIRKDIQQTVKAVESQIRKERRKAQTRAAAKRYREEIKSLTKREKAYLKAARTLGLKVPPSMAKIFGEYLDVRFAQGNDSVFYRISNYVEDFQSVMDKKGYDAKQTMNDFNKYMADRDILLSNKDSMVGLDFDKDIWKVFAEKVIGAIIN